jgi:hypothetical protein
MPVIYSQVSHSQYSLPPHRGVAQARLNRRARWLSRCDIDRCCRLDRVGACSANAKRRVCEYVEYKGTRELEGPTIGCWHQSARSRLRGRKGARKRHRQYFCIERGTRVLGSRVHCRYLAEVRTRRVLERSTVLLQVPGIRVRPLATCRLLREVASSSRRHSDRVARTLPVTDARRILEVAY